MRQGPSVFQNAEALLASFAGPKLESGENIGKKLEMINDIEGFMKNSKHREILMQIIKWTIPNIKLQLKMRPTLIDEILNMILTRKKALLGLSKDQREKYKYVFSCLSIVD